MKKEEKTKVKDLKNKKDISEKKNQKKEKSESVFAKIEKYFRGVFKELERIRWTNKKDLVKYSITTVIFVIFFGLYFYAIDWIALLVRSLAN